MATICISPTGNDTTGTGSEINPYATVAKAHTVGANGDTVKHLGGGAIAWVAQTFFKALTVEGHSDGSSIFDGTLATGLNNFAWLAQNGALTVRNLEFRNLFGCGAVVFDVRSGAQFLIDNCNIHDLSFVNYDYGTGVAGSTNVVAGSLMKIIASDIHHIESAATNEGSVFCAVGGSGAMDLQLYNSVVYLDATGGSRLRQLLENVFNYSGRYDFKNSVIWNDGSTMYQSGYPGASLTLTNCIYSNDTITGGAPGTTPETLINTVNEDPLLQDAANGDFRTRRGSRCRSSGVAL